MTQGDEQCVVGATSASIITTSSNKDLNLMDSGAASGYSTDSEADVAQLVVPLHFFQAASNAPEAYRLPGALRFHLAGGGEGLENELRVWEDQYRMWELCSSCSSPLGNREYQFQQSTGQFMMLENFYENAHMMHLWLM